MKTIDILKKEESKAINVLNEIRREIKKYWIIKHKEDFGIYIGAIVTLKDGKKAIVEAIDAKYSYGHKPCIQGRIEKKDGSFGKALRNLYSDWDICI